MPVDAKTFRQALGHFAAGVTVVTTQGAERLAGLTVTAFASLSLDPPLVLVSIAHSARSYEIFSNEASHFGVTILRADQEEVAMRFARPDSEKFPAGSYTLSANGVPLLNEGLVSLECRIANQVPGGDHTIFIGEVLSARIFEGEPLVYFRSQFGQFADLSAIASLPQATRVAAH
jgi:flavin reductase (DIM6/NTAB) family NADH-FMN oxidoreductase RutF